VLSLMTDYNDSFAPETESGVLLKPLTELHDPSAIKLAYNELLNKREDIYETNLIMVEECTRGQSKCWAWFGQ